MCKRFSRKVSSLWQTVDANSAAKLSFATQMLKLQRSNTAAFTHQNEMKRFSV
jgi:hypothetical protein